ncbi:MAG: helix-turn-helix domain-containing protein [Clostridiales bacterium]|nr:helix-turn-helix domain-containing protein [Clostridiales bacterium]
MPRVALTDEQRMQYAVKDACNVILEELNAQRGRKRMTNEDLAEKMKISKPTWWRWNKGDIAKAELGTVLMAAMRAGLDIKIVVSQK